ncbi:energy transducer TonB [Pendulispora brunnea]|uniref:Energy transducer TonB n=1 Tax=Pendulispora brunnea TaxID=2905690 RepID=A0ABZ2KS89_9BACT
MHNRIHPIFADTFLASLDGLPPQDPRNKRSLVVRLEIVLSREGNVTRVGIVRSSGNRDFDMGALDSVLRAAPFGVAPDIILSYDGRVYLHWEFHRDDYACITINARPFLLVAAPAP